MPVQTGMTLLPSSSQPHNPSPQPDQALDAAALPTQRAWSVRRLMFLSLVLLVGVILTVQYLSQSPLSTQSSLLRKRSFRSLTNPPLSCCRS